MNPLEEFLDRERCGWNENKLADRQGFSPLNVNRDFLPLTDLVGGRFGPSRLTRILFTRNREKLVSSYRKLLELDFDRVIVNHGNVLPSGGKELLAESVREIFGTAIL